MATQENFELFLIEEFKEQHANMRQAENSAVQFVQQALTGEGLIIAGLFTLISVKISLNIILIVATLGFLVLSLFLHIVFLVCTAATTAVWGINSQNAFTRMYFGQKFSHRKYIYFYPPESFFHYEKHKWENIKGVMPSISLYIGYINTVNIVTFLCLLFINGIILTGNNINSLVSNWIGIVIVIIFIIVISTIFRFYVPFIYRLSLDKSNKKTHQERLHAYNRINPQQPILKDDEFLQQLVLIPNDASEVHIRTK